MQDDLYQGERGRLEASLASDHERASVKHRQTHATLLETIQRLQIQYRKSYQGQQNYFQMRKDEIINQVIYLFIYLFCF